MYIVEKRHHLIAQYSQLKKKCTVEHGVGTFLIRKYPLVFATTHTRPSSYGFFGRTSSVLVVAYNTTYHTVVCVRNIVVVV